MVDRSMCKQQSLVQEAAGSDGMAKLGQGQSKQVLVAQLCLTFATHGLSCGIL